MLLLASVAASSSQVVQASLFPHNATGSPPPPRQQLNTRRCEEREKNGYRQEDATEQAHRVRRAANSALGEAARSDRDPAGGRVVTYARWPLYTYLADTKPGQAKAEDGFTQPRRDLTVRCHR